MTEVVLQKSNKKGKKYDAIIDGKKTVSFGAIGYSDFTKHKDARQSLAKLRDEERKERYIARHKVNQDASPEARVLNATGKTITLLDFGRKIFYGINRL